MFFRRIFAAAVALFAAGSAAAVDAENTLVMTLKNG